MNNGLIELLEEINEIQGIERIRLGHHWSLTIITEEFAAKAIKTRKNLPSLSFISYKVHVMQH